MQVLLYSIQVAPKKQSLRVGRGHGEEFKEGIVLFSSNSLDFSPAGTQCGLCSPLFYPYNSLVREHILRESDWTKVTQLSSMAQQGFKPESPRSLSSILSTTTCWLSLNPERKQI